MIVLYGSQLVELWFDKLINFAVSRTRLTTINSKRRTRNYLYLVLGKR